MSRHLLAGGLLVLAGCSSEPSDGGGPSDAGGLADSLSSTSDDASGADAPGSDSQGNDSPIAPADGPADAPGGRPDAGLGADANAADSGPPPTWSTQFVANSGQWPNVVSQPAGSVMFGLPDPSAEDNNVVQLLFPGKPNLDAGSLEGTMYASEIDTPIMFQYGTFRARLKLPVCDQSEEVVNGFFTYFNDGQDENHNGIIDNSEIDIEILCGRPHVISLTIWTDYTSDASFLGMSRQVDLSTGSYSQTMSPSSYDLTPMGTQPQFLRPGFYDPNTFYEMGFDWRPSEIRFFIVMGGAEITLWDYTDPAHIPTLTSQLSFNLWHAGTHWTGDNSAANYPAHDAVARIDWARYWR